MSELLEGLNAAQKQIVLHDKGPCVAAAVAGAGKTHAVVHRIAYLVKHRGVDPRRILAITYTKAGATEMNTRLTRMGVAAEVRTFHSLAYSFCNQHVYDPTEKLDTGYMFTRLIKCAMSYKELKLENYGLDVSDLQLAIEMLKENLVSSAEALKKFPGDHLAAVYDKTDELHDRLSDGEHVAGLTAPFHTFADLMFNMGTMIVREDSLRAVWQKKWDYVIQDEAQDQSVAQFVIGAALAMKHRNYMLVGDAAQCHPPGVMVEVEEGKSVPIETLAEDATTIRSWNRNAQKMVSGRKFEVGVRPYAGELVTMHVDRVDKRITLPDGRKLPFTDRRSVPMTPNHRVLCRWTDRTSKVCVTYLMYRQQMGFRVGWCQLFSQQGEGNRPFHLGQRARLEKADRVWILKVHVNRTDASVYESIVAAKYGLPTATFEPVKGARHLTKEAIAQIFGSNDWTSRGLKCLDEHKRQFDYPLYPFPTGGRRGTYFEVFAANLEPTLMSVPWADVRGRDAWTPIHLVERSLYSGPVYSLNVEKDHSYAANGVVVLNCIYSFRGAAPHMLKEFADEWKAKIILMNKNYRSVAPIISAANQALDQVHPDDKFEGQEVEQARENAPGTWTIKPYNTLYDEAEGVVKAIADLIHEKKVRPRDIAVLYRINVQGAALEDALCRVKVPYRIAGAVNLYDRSEVKSLLSYLRLVVGEGTNEDLVAAARRPYRYFSKRLLAGLGNLKYDPRQTFSSQLEYLGRRHRLKPNSLEKWEEFYTQLDEWREFFDEDTDADASELLDTILEGTGYIKALQKAEGELSAINTKEVNIARFKNLSELFSVTELLDYVEKMRVHIQDTRAAYAKVRNCVQLMTIHKSKGLEWPCVFVIGCNEGLLPFKGEVREEARLFYVATTRARDQLIYTCASSSGVDLHGRKAQRSRFLPEKEYDRVGTTVDLDFGRSLM